MPCWTACCRRGGTAGRATLATAAAAPKAWSRSTHVNSARQRWRMMVEGCAAGARRNAASNSALRVPDWDGSPKPVSFPASLCQLRREGAARTARSTLARRFAGRRHVLPSQRCGAGAGAGGNVGDAGGVTLGALRCLLDLEFGPATLGF